MKEQTMRVLDVSGDYNGRYRLLEDRGDGTLVIEADTSLDAILERQGARRATADEFAEYLGQLPTDGEG